tara:strand:- start:32 stop:652 length:621 start_codon:yes stop_codon:yes gene_type:complete
MKVDFYLASRSSRRVNFLRAAGYQFECRPADISEVPKPAEPADEFVQRMAHEKAAAVLAQLTPASGAPVLAADTVVSIDGHILGKPSDREDAIAMLLRLSGKCHQVMTAVSMQSRDESKALMSRTEVLFGPISEREAADYWATGEPQDKAGSYAIQGHAANWVREVHGSYTGVVGLPMFETISLLKTFAIHAAPRTNATDTIKETP